MATTEIKSILAPTFPQRHITSALSHYEEVTKRYQEGDWERATSRGGMFVEAVLKGVCDSVGVPQPTGRQFNVGRAIGVLQNLTADSCHDSLRVVIPRACRFVYDIASNRGARHDPDEVDPNRVDASVVLPVISWILSEMIRVASKGASTLDESSQLVESLSARKYPFFEQIGNRKYINIEGLKPKEIILLVFYAVHPRRLRQSYILDTVEGHGHTRNAAQKAWRKMKNLFDESEDGFILRGTGRREAEDVLEKVRNQG